MVTNKAVYANWFMWVVTALMFAALTITPALLPDMPMWKYVGLALIALHLSAVCFWAALPVSNSWVDGWAAWLLSLNIFVCIAYLAMNDSASAYVGLIWMVPLLAGIYRNYTRVRAIELNTTTA